MYTVKDGIVFYIYRVYQHFVASATLFSHFLGMISKVMSLGIFLQEEKNGK